MITYYQPEKALIDGQLVDRPLIGVENGNFVAVHRDVRSMPVDDANARIQPLALDGMLMIPGLVNAQTHAFHVLMRGFIDDLSFYQWRERGIYRLALDLSPEDVYHGARQAFAEMLGNGITTVVDFFYMNYKENDFASAVIKAALSVGIRLVLARGMFDWQGGPDAFREPVPVAVRNTGDLIALYEDEPTITVVPAPHSLHAASVEMIEAAWELALENRSRMYLHVAAGQGERDECIQQHGRPPVAFLHHCGLVGRSLTAVHASAIDASEVALLADSGVTVVHTPASSLAVGGGFFKLRDLLDAGVSVALGTDSPASNNRLSIFDELRLASLLQKSRLGRGDATTAEEVWPLGTRGGAEATGLNVGRIAVGFHADFVLLDLMHPTLRPAQRLLHHLVYSDPVASIRAVYMGGEMVFEDGAPRRVSHVELVRKSDEVTRRWR